MQGIGQSYVYTLEKASSLSLNTTMKNYMKTVMLGCVAAIGTLLSSCGTEDEDHGYIQELGAYVYNNENNSGNDGLDSEVVTYIGFWQWNSNHYEETVLQVLPYAVLLSTPPCRAIVEYSVPEEYRQEAAGTIVTEPLVLLIQRYANSNSTDYYDNMVTTTAFTVNYGGQTHTVTFDVGPESQYYYDRNHQLPYVLLYVKNIALDGNTIKNPDMKEALKFMPMSKRK